MFLWIALGAAIAAAADINYVLRNETFTSIDLPPALVGAKWTLAENSVIKLQATTANLDNGPAFVLPKLFFTNFCFTGEFLDPTNATMRIAGDNIPAPSPINHYVSFNLSRAGDSYWCLDTTLPPGYYTVQVLKVHWWQSITLSLPIPAPSTAISENVVARQYSLATENDDVVSLNSEVVSIPEGSKARTGIFAATPWVSPNSSITIHSPPGAAFLILYGMTFPTSNPHWGVDANCTFNNKLPWHPVNESQPVTLFTKGSSLVDSNRAAVFMTPLDPTIRTNFTISGTWDSTYNFTNAAFYFVNDNPFQNTTNSTSTTAGIETGPSAAPTATETNGMRTGLAGSSAAGKSSSPGAIAGGVVGGVVGLAAIIAIIVFLLRRKRPQGPVTARNSAREVKEDDMFVIEDNQPALLPTPLETPLSPYGKSSLPPGADPPELPPVFLKGTTRHMEPQPFTKTRSSQQTSPSAETSSPNSAPASSNSGRRRPRGPRFRNDVDAGGLHQVADDEGGDDTDSDAETVLMPPTYDPRWRNSEAPTE